MKKWSFLVVFLFVLFVLVGCGDNNDTNDDKGSEDKNNDGKQTVTLNASEKVEITLGDSSKLEYTLENGDESKLTIVSDSENVSVSGDVIKGEKIGSANITISYKDGEVDISKVVSVSVKQPKINITFNGDGRMALDTEKSQMLDFSVDKDVDLEKAMYEFNSSDESVATINSKGEVTTKKTGRVNFVIKSKIDDSISFSYECEIYIDAIKVIEKYNIESPLYQEVTTYGSSTMTEKLRGSVNYYTPMEMNLIENIIPITTGSPYVGKSPTPELITEADNACKWVRSGILHSETSKITYHDTGNNSAAATADMHAKHLVGEANLAYRARSWHYTVDETCVIHHIPDEEVTWQGDTYEAYTTSIGVETCVNQNSDLEVTWHRTAKLMSSLLVKHGLKITDIVQHYDWNQKNCPQTLRRNNLYGYAMEMIRAELDALTILSDYTIEFTSLRPDLVNNNGHIIKVPETATRIGYIVTVTDKEGNKQSKTLFSNIPGLDGSSKVEGDNTKLDEFHGLLANVNNDNIGEVIEFYNTLSDSEKNNCYGINYLIGKIKEARTNNPNSISFEEVCVDETYRYKYFEIKNNTSSDINLKGYKIKYSDGTNEVVKTLNDKVIASDATFIVFAGRNDNISKEEVLYPDMALDIDLASKGSLEIIDASGNSIEKINYDGNVTRVSSTNNEKDDFLALYPSALNSKGEKYEVRDKVTEKVIETEVAILLIPTDVTKDDGSLIDAAYALYNSLTKNEKNKVRNFTNLKNLKAKYDALG